MNKLLLVLLLISTEQCVSQKHPIPVINKSLVKVNDLLWDLEKLSIPPKVKWIKKKGSVYSLLYKSVDYERKPTQVFAYYSNPDILMGRPAGNRKFPGVVLVHGGGGRAFKWWVEKWAADGYAAIAMDLSGNGPDGKKIKHPGPDQSVTNKFKKIETGDIRDVWSYQAVADILLAHSLLLDLPEVDTGKTCITGISWGGYLTCIAASLDNRFKAAAPVYGCGYYDETGTFKAKLSGLSPTMKHKWMHYFDPSGYLSSAKSPFLFINGNKDRHYYVVPYHKTYSLIPFDQRTICIKPDMKHNHPSGAAPPEIRYFFESVINGSAPLPKIGKPIVKDGIESVPFRTPVQLFYAEFYYSNDAVSNNYNRTWKVKRATINQINHTISCRVPDGGFKYAFFYVVDQRHLTVSSEFIIN